MNNPAKPLLATLVLLLAGSTGVLAAEGQYSYLRMQLNGSPELQLGIEPELRDMSPVVAYISTVDVTGPDGVTIPANTLGIVGTAMIDMTMGRTKVLSITLFDVNGPGTYDVVEHDGLIVYTDGSRGMRPIENVRGWVGTADDPETGGTVTITEVGDAVPGFGWPVKGYFHITVPGGLKYRSRTERMRDRKTALLTGDFGWGGL